MRHELHTANTLLQLPQAVCYSMQPIWKYLDGIGLRDSMFSTVRNSLLSICRR